jgi:hypothetical protein
MSLTNYQDVSKRGASVDAGFQFDFYCGNCSRRWKSPFKPYRRGQFSGLMYKLAYFIDMHGRISRASNVVANAGEKRARQAALDEAIAQAEQRYFACPGCRNAVCQECWNPQTQRCESCAGKREQHAGVRDAPVSASGDESPVAGSSSNPSSSPGLACPNCRGALGGGRFCAECGFDMASTHKSCPGCGAMCTRAARFCPDCGHGF